MSWWDDFTDWVGDVVDDVVDWVEDAFDYVVDTVFPGYTDDNPSVDRLNAEIRGVLVNKAGTNEPIPVIYGRRKVGGITVLKTVGGSSNEFLYKVFIVCEGEIDSFEAIYLDDVLSTDAKFAAYLTINEHLGADDQAADSMLLAAGIIASTDTYSGIAYLVFKFTYDTDVFRRDPVIHVVVNGRKVLDVTDLTTGLSDDSASCTYDYLTNNRFGKGLDASQLNLASFQAAQATLATLVTPYSGAPTQKMLTCNAVLDTSNEIMANVRILLSGMLGMLPHYDGEYHLLVEGPGSSSFSFDEGNVLAGLSIEGPSKQDRYNRVVATFINPDKNWQPDQISYPEADSAEYTTLLAEDNGFARQKTVTLPTIADAYRARYIAQVFLYRSRYTIKTAFRATLEALALTIGDIADLTLTSPGWAGKEFRVLGLSHNPDATIGVSGIEHQDAIFPWSMATQEDVSPPTNLPDPNTVTAPGAPVVVETLYTSTQSSGVKAKATVSWAASVTAQVDVYQLEYKLSSGSTWSVLPRQTAITIDLFDMVPGTYDFRVKAINHIGSSSDYATNLNQEITGLSAPPAAPTGLTISSIGGLAVLRWDQATDLDVLIGGSVIFRHDSLQAGASWSTSITIGNAVAGADTVAILPLKPGTYLAKFVDASGIPSGAAASIPTSAATVIAFANVDSVSEHSAFAGSHAGTVADGGNLTLAGNSNIDTWADFDAVPDVDNEGGIAPTGTYDFASGIDLGSVKAVRLSSVITVQVVNTLDKIDSRAGNIDDWEDFDGGGAATGADAQVWFRETDDDPGGSPTWSAWNRLDAAEVEARGLDFQCRLSSIDPAYGIRVSELTVNVDEVA
tara:strand:- start:983 stop:3523 length:2541 start_codon:yes stop_codon:yes gene_type:complete